MTRLARGSDTRVPGKPVVWYEDLYKPGDTLSQAMARLTTPAVISFPAGRFVTSDFRTNGSYYATVIPKNCLGIWGSGRGAIGSNVGTIFSMVPNSSTRKGDVPAQDNSTAVQMRNLMHIGPTGTDLTYGQFHVEGTDQGHIYHNFTIYNAPGKITCRDILVSGHYGNNGAPPGETFGMEIHGNNNGLTDPHIVNCEADGRRDIGGPNYGGVGFDLANVVSGGIRNCYSHHSVAASFVLFQAFNVRTYNCYLGDPSDSDGTGVDGWNIGGWFNHERTSGSTHQDMVINRVFKGRGKSVHVTHSNDSYTFNGYSSANGTIQFINPTWNDIWGDNKFYIQSWHPYWNTCTMSQAAGAGAQFAIGPDRVTPLPSTQYKYVHQF
jgi:hypothetical protein